MTTRRRFPIKLISHNRNRGNYWGINIEIQRIRLMPICLLIYVLILPFQQSTAFAFDSSLRSWVTLDIPVFAENSTYIKFTAVTLGNNLDKGLWIEEPLSADNDGSSFGVIVQQGHAVIEAIYSSDTNTTTFTYIVPPEQYRLMTSGEFPNDRKEITIQFNTDFNVNFDPRIKFCVTPTPNYYGMYNVTGNFDASRQQGQQGIYYVNLEVRHPEAFYSHTKATLGVPLKILFVLFAISSVILIIAFIINKYEVYEYIIAIGSAVIVFLPIFQIATSDLKIPLQITPFDNEFLLLLELYVGLVILALILRIFRESINAQKIRRLFVDSTS